MKGDREMERNYERTGRIVLAEDYSFGVDVTAHFDSEDETYGEIRYSHIMTASPCDRPILILQGWSEQNGEDNRKWTEIVKRLEECDVLLDWLAGDEEGSAGTMEISEKGLLSEVREV